MAKRTRWQKMVTKFRTARLKDRVSANESICSSICGQYNLNEKDTQELRSLCMRSPEWRQFEAKVCPW